MAANVNNGHLMTMGLLDDGRQDRRAYVISTAINGTVLLLFTMFGVQRYVVHKQVRNTKVITYVVAMPPPTRAIKVLKVPQPKYVPPPSAKTPAFQAPVPAAAPHLSTVPVAPEPAAPKPPITTPLPAPTVAEVHPPVVKIGTFGAADAPQPVISPTPHPAAAVVVGSFGTPSATTSNNPRGNAVVATHFGSSAGVTLPTGHPTVTPAGFSSHIGSASTPGTVTTQSQTHSPTVTFVPHPTYTQDAKAKRIEGDVAVNVIFLASGQVQVLGVVHSLDPGLDKEALNVAQKIKFTPATRNNAPVDFNTVVHIKFQLS